MSTPLIKATVCNEPEAIITLLNNGANINMKHGETGRTALHYAARKGPINLMTILLDHGADGDTIDNDEMTPLLIAMTRVSINNDMIDKIRLLVNYGVNIKVRDRHGQTPLHIAVMRKADSIIMLLLSMADDKVSLLNMVDYNNYNPLLLAIHNKVSTEIISLLSRGTTSNVLHGLAYTNHFKEVRQLIKEGHDCNQKNSNGLTPLHIAIISKNYEMMQLLIDQGSNIHMPCNNDNINCNNKTPLQLAKEQGILIYGH